MSIDFFLSVDQMFKADQFIKNHECTIEKDEFGHKKFGAIGGGVTYHFSPTGLGVIQSVSCACGKELNLTDFDCW